MKKQTFAVSGMKCVHCKMHVEDALRAVPGVSEVLADLAGGQVAVSYDENLVTPAMLKQAVETLGRYTLSL